MTRVSSGFAMALIGIAGLLVCFSNLGCERKGGPATVTRLEPDNGTTLGGDQISIVGSGFEPGKTTAEVRFGRKRAESVVIASSTTINVTTPPNERGPSEITVILNDGQAFTIPEGFRFVEPQDASKVRDAYLKTQGKTK